jgi:hypothetical protein
MKDRVFADFPDTDEVIFKNEQSELVIYLDDGTPLLSQAVSFFADAVGGGKPTRPTFIVDALTGEIVFEYEGLTHGHCGGGDCLLDETNLSGKIRSWQYFQFTVPGSSNGKLLEISISGGGGDADMYTREGSPPTLNNYACRPFVNGNNETCSTQATDGAIWHVGIYGYRRYSGVDLLAELKSLSLYDGTGPGGNLKTGMYEYGTDFGYLDVVSSNSDTTCTMNNANVKTVDLNHGTSGSTAYEYACPENTWKYINGAYSPLNDAHFFGGVVYDMYNAYVGVPPLDFQLTMRVHYSTNYQNAFWNGSSMTFGDGGSTFYPLVSLDVSAHEVSHGFTEQNSDLIYSGQSGGINEAFSDISGEAAEFYMHGDNDFLVGADIYKASTGALRNMCSPTGSSIGHVDDYYNGMDVHYSSGVFNKAFCLIAQTSGWDTYMAFLIFARANQMYWTESTNFDDGAQGVVDAAHDEGFSESDVIDAFAAVGILGLVSSGGGGTDDPPYDVSVDSPDGVDPVSGTVDIIAFASDDNGVDQVEFFIDGGRIHTDSTDDGWTASWDTTGYSEGSHEITVVATDTIDQTTASSGVTVTVDNVLDPAAKDMHVEAILLDTVNTGQGWKQGTAEVTVFDNLGNPVDGVDVAGTFVVDVTGSTAGTTGASGVALLTSTGVPQKGKVNFTFCVDDITGGTLPYVVDENTLTCADF